MYQNNRLFKNKYRVDSCRLKGWDYSMSGYYFITICTNNRIHYFGQIENEKMYLSDIGRIAKEYWQEISEHFPFVILDEYIVMPNHVHGILVINNNNDVEAQNFAPLRNGHENKFGPQSKNLASIIRGFKIGVKKYATINNIEFAWQSRFHDHIIRNEESLYNIRQYIINNPEKWWRDRNNKKGLYI